MIEITHQNARRLIRLELDAALHEGEWSRLAVHLETCPACRGYRQSLRDTELGLRRALRSGLEAVPAPQENIAAEVLAARLRRARLRRRAAAAAGALAALVIFFALGGPGWIAELFSPAENPSPAAGNAEPAAPAAPTPAAGEFAGVLAYESRRMDGPGGDMEIYLLNPGGGPVNLTNHPANDTAPTWSPDGEWVAFLSDRASSPGQKAKTELWVTAVTGSPSVQLTSEPGITWQEPLSWSPDGRWIALTGRREAQGGESWVYLVPLDGAAPRSLAGTRGGGSPKFSPTDPNRLAFTYQGEGESELHVLRLDSGIEGSRSLYANPLAAQPHSGASFDWSPDGASLAFITGGAAGTQAVAEGSISTISVLSAGWRSEIVARSRWPSAYRAVSWTPDGAVAYVEALSDARARASSPLPADECWQLRTRRFAYQGLADGRVFTAGELCLESGFDLDSWTGDGLWLAAVGRRPGESQRALYAVRVPGRAGRVEAQPQGSQEVEVLQLAADPGTLHPPRVRPRPQPGTEPLAIDPRPARKARAGLPPSDLTRHPGGPPGKLVYAVQNNAMSLVVSTNPDGTGGKVLYASSGLNDCPRWSPDGRQVALVQYLKRELAPGKAQSGGARSGLARAAPAGGSWPYFDPEIAVLDAGGGTPRRISESGLLPEAGPDPLVARYSCPVWSPDGAPGGPYIATIVTTARGGYLAMLSLNGGRMRFVPIPSPVPGVEPVWSADGRRIFSAQYSPTGETQRVAVTSLPDDPRLPLNSIMLSLSGNWEEIYGMIYSRENSLLYLLTVADLRGSPSLLSLRPVKVQYLVEPAVVEGAPLLIGESYASFSLERIAPAWLSDGSLGLALRGGPSEAVKTHLARFDLQSGRLVPLAEVEDKLSGAFWSRDGRWLVYSTESGLWGLDVAAAALGRAGPVWLSPLPVTSVDWQ